VASPNSHEDECQSTVYSNAPSPIEAIITPSLEAHMTGECTIPEEIIAVFGASDPIEHFNIVSIYYDFFPRSAGQITYVLAIAIGSTIVLHFEALRLLARSRKI
jgi:hypothetical protein